ncbi:MAG TPA: SRPBCC family protein [Xanthomonadaceae bacterium]|nr:SRPBCC family protein [Xanthomonadaceae bacterium]
MTRLIEIVISLAIVAALFLVVGLVLPSHRHLSEQVETNRKLTIVYDTLDSFRRFKDWNPLVLRDPRMKVQLSGPDSGVGATLSYSSEHPQLGDGSYKITAAEPGQRITYGIENAQRGGDKKTTFSFKPTGHAGRNVLITQTYDVDYGWDLLGRYAGMYVRSHVGDDMKLGLQRLTNMLASVPNADYRAQGVRIGDLKIVDRPAEDLLVVNAGAIARDQDKLKAAMNADMEWIKRSIDASGLTAAGPMRIVSTEFGTQNYTFDVVVPVRRGGDATAVAADVPLTGLKLQGPVKYVHAGPVRAASASYTGYMMELENAHNMLRAWALTNGYEVIDRPYEVYRNGVEGAFSEDGQFEMYWNIK